MAYTTDLKSVARKGLWVQVPPRLPLKTLTIVDYGNRPFLAHPKLANSVQPMGSTASRGARLMDTDVSRCGKRYRDYFGTLDHPNIGALSRLIAIRPVDLPPDDTKY